MKADRQIKLKRFDQYRQGGTYDFMLPANYGPWVKHDEAVKLVKAERARVRRIIKAQKSKKWSGDHTTAKAMNLAHQSACNCILVALNRRTP